MLKLIFSQNPTEAQMATPPFMREAHYRPLQPSWAQMDLLSENVFELLFRNKSAPQTDIGYIKREFDIESRQKSQEVIKLDLHAYTQIENLEKVAKDNNIEIPRLRGYRLMKDEIHVSSDDLKRLMRDCEVDVCERLCRSAPYWSGNANIHSYGSTTDIICDYYLEKSVNEDGCEKYTGIRWDRIHGWKRKVLKFEIKKKNRNIKEQFDMWNKYAGKENVLYIHARIGGGNWSYFGGNDLAKKPWFLGKADDWFDETYCDIYALINK